MLGKDASIKTSKSQSDGSRTKSSFGGPVPKKSLANSQKRNRADELDASSSEDEGRAASFKSKRSKQEKSKHGVEKPQVAPEHATMDDEPLEKRDLRGETLDTKQATQEHAGESPEASDDETYHKPKNSASILDQVIAERQKKKKKKKRKKLKAESRKPEGS